MAHKKVYAKKKQQIRGSYGLLSVFIGITALLALSVWWYGQKNKTVVLGDQTFNNNRHNPNWGASIGKPRRPDADPPEDIPLLLVQNECDMAPKPDLAPLQLRLNEAFVVTHIPGLDTELQEQARYDTNLSSYLVLQGWGRNIATPAANHTGEVAFYPEWYFRLVRPDKEYKPLTYGEYAVPSYETRVFWVLFPIKPSEKTFTIKFCIGTNPQSIPLDFTSSKVVHVNGVYSELFGLMLQK